MRLWIFGLTYCLVSVGFPSVLQGVTDHVDQTTSPTNRCQAPETLPHILRIAAFNIQRFGIAKMNDSFKADIISRISSCTVVCSKHFESTDYKWTPFYKTLKAGTVPFVFDWTKESTPRRAIKRKILSPVKRPVQERSYGMVNSTRLGKKSSSYREQYAYFYKKSRLDLIDSHQYNNYENFTRPPFCVLLRPKGGTWNLTLIGVHTRPTDAVKEIGNLEYVYNNVTDNTWSGEKNVIIMGDMNADGSNVTKSKLAALPIYNQPQLFYWPIGFDVYTNIKHNTDKRAYDRFILSGNKMKAAYVPKSAKIYEFENAHPRLSYDQMTGISDHYPIELQLY